MIAFLALLAAQPAADVTNLCQADLPRINGQRVAWVNLNVDAKFQRISAEVFLRKGELDAQWSIGRQKLRDPSSMIYLRYDVPVTHSFVEPVTLWAITDGHKGVEVSNAKVHEQVTFSAEKTFVSEEVATITETTVPNLFGVSSFIVEGRDKSGRIFRSTASMPNWSWFERETKRALAAAERKRAKKQCGPSMYF
jgi:hypothetical protein